MPDQILLSAVNTIGTVTSVADLLAMVGQLRDRFPGHLLLFRGELELHGVIRSQRARRAFAFSRSAIEGLQSLVLSAIGAPLDSPNAFELSQAVLQHYSAATHFVDLTADPEVAAWFARRQLLLHDRQK